LYVSQFICLLKNAAPIYGRAINGIERGIECRGAPLHPTQNARTSVDAFERGRNISIELRSDWRCKELLAGFSVNYPQEPILPADGYQRREKSPTARL
jgi:hypothetical protein